ncbi:formate dehydrogenase subunit alpha, partial [Clostridioides difficile]|nr:formate dehydrogenase subunit alpha [Clostridioides difficile]
KTAAEIMDEIASVTPAFGGISFERLDRGETLQWPCPDKESKGTYIMHVGKFSRGLGYFYPAKYRPSKELPDNDYPFMMVTGRMLYHYNTRAMTGR